MINNNDNNINDNDKLNDFKVCLYKVLKAADVDIFWYSF